VYLVKAEKKNRGDEKPPRGIPKSAIGSIHPFGHEVPIFLKTFSCHALDKNRIFRHDI
jgi:hypothetical protein